MYIFCNLLISLFILDILFVLHIVLSCCTICVALLMTGILRAILLSGQAVDYCGYFSCYKSKEGHLYVFQCWEALLKYFEQLIISDYSSDVKSSHSNLPWTFILYLVRLVVLGVDDRFDLIFNSRKFSPGFFCTEKLRTVWHVSAASPPVTFLLGSEGRTRWENVCPRGGQRGDFSVYHEKGEIQF